MIYFDNASTTKIDEEVKIELIKSYENIWGNPSSLHKLGFEAEKKIKESRKIIANKLGVNEKFIYFTPSGTIANNSVLNSFDIVGKNIVVSEIEHTSIFSKTKSMKFSEVRYVKVDKYGFVDEDDLINKIDENTILVSIIHVNSELGSINDINKLAKLSKKKKTDIKFHSDGVQAFNKIKINLKDIDFYTISSHKIHGPKGIAAIYLRNSELFQPLYLGGPQEKGLFSGTENVQAILAFSKACQIDNNYKNITKINKYLREELLKVKGSILNSPMENYSPYILNACFNKIGSEILLHYLEMDDIYISTGSACNKKEKSRVIEVIKLSEEYSNGCIRISLCKDNTIEEAEIFIEKLKQKIEIIRRTIR